MTDDGRDTIDKHEFIDLEPVTGQLVESLAGYPPIHTLSPDAARKLLADLQAAPSGRPSATIEEVDLRTGPAGKIPLRIVRPENAGHAILPVVMYFHGGGWMMGDLNTHDRLVRELAAGVRAAVVLVEFSRSPESRYPAQVEEAYAATKYVAENAIGLVLDASRLAVAGDGTGANLATAVTLLAKERRGPKIGLQVLFSPVTSSDFGSGSYVAFRDGPWLSRAAMQWFWDAYLPDPSARRHPTATPLNATLDQLSGLPEALVIVAENDVLRDEGEAYARRLAAAGVRVTAVRYNGTIHDFVVLNALADTPAARAAIAQAIAALRAALE